MTYNLTISYDEADKIKDPVVMKHFDALLDTVGNFELTKKMKQHPRYFLFWIL